MSTDSDTSAEHMSQLDFGALSPYEFELVCQDLMAAALGTTVDSFAPGPDGGIDLLAEIESKIIAFQCKHYARSGVRQLITDLKKANLHKVPQLKIDEYVLLTSVSLTAQRKRELLELLANATRAKVKVYGQEDLNFILRNHPHVRRQHLKLWLTDLLTLKAVQQAPLFHRTRMTLAGLRQKLAIYVPNPSYERASQALKETNICLIVGPPGVGKTLLAEMLMPPYIQGGWEIYIINEDAREIESLWEDGQRQLFLYDDFLGQSSLAEKLRPREASRLLAVMEEITSTTTKKLIMTTRDYILHQARHSYEPLNTPLIDFAKTYVRLEDYTAQLRGEILYNHLAASDGPPELLRGPAKAKDIEGIIRHTNFNPRLVSSALHMVKFARRRGLINQLQSVLANPAVVWKSAFEDQISTASRCLLLALTTFPPQPVEFSSLRLAAATIARLEYNMDGPSPWQFRESLRELENTFITITPALDTEIAFANPGVRDFLLKWIAGESLLIPSLVACAASVDQKLNLLRLASSSGPLSRISSENVAKLLRSLAEIVEEWVDDCVGFEQGWIVLVEASRAHASTLRQGFLRDPTALAKHILSCQFDAELLFESTQLLESCGLSSDWTLRLRARTLRVWNEDYSAAGLTLASVGLRMLRAWGPDMSAKERKRLLGTAKAAWMGIRNGGVPPLYAVREFLGLVEELGLVEPREITYAYQMMSRPAEPVDRLWTEYLIVPAGWRPVSKARSAQDGPVDRKLVERIQALLTE